MKGIILLANGFEDTEALTTIDVLIRAGENIIRVGVNSLEVISQNNTKIICDVLLDNINPSNYDYLIIPGGKAAFTILNVDKRIENIIDEFILNNKLALTSLSLTYLDNLSNFSFA